jgi:hypothetical protein
MSYIYFSYGMTKSASSFVYQLQEQIVSLSHYNLVQIPPKIRENNARENYLEPITDEKIIQILDWIPENSITVIKTHGAPSKLALKLIGDGKAFASATFRDPRDIAISLTEHGQRSRDKGISDFAEFMNPTDPISEIKIQIEKRFKPWINNPACLPLNYKLIKESPLRVAESLLNQMQMNDIDAKEVLAPFEDKANIIHFNKGEGGRYNSLMTEEEINIFRTEFEDFIEYCK